MDNAQGWSDVRTNHSLFHLDFALKEEKDRKPCLLCSSKTARVCCLCGEHLCKTDRGGGSTCFEIFHSSNMESFQFYLKTQYNFDVMEKVTKRASRENLKRAQADDEEE